MFKIEFIKSYIDIKIKFKKYYLIVKNQYVLICIGFFVLMKYILLAQLV